MKKLGLIALAVVVALGMLGIGYAYWTDQLVITGNANTGNLSVKIVDVQSDDPDGELDPGYDYDVAETIVEKGTDQKSASITINGAYPGYVTGANATVQNTGTVPVKVKSIALNYVSGDMGLFHYMSLDAWSFNGGPIPAVGYVLMPGDAATFDADFSFDSNDPETLAQDSGVCVTVTIIVTQFNDPDAGHLP